LHGHLGPFLVIGVRTGILAKRALDTNAEENSGLRVTAKLPLSTPFSCVLDGIQATTQCTIGNQRLSIENSPSKIEVSFQHKNQGELLKIGVNPEVIDNLKIRFSEGASNEVLAWEIASMPDIHLFTLVKE
jgi:formylmethanofuran dehydrogenase subunit E